MSTGERYHSLDNLRATAMVAGVVFHAALAYSPLVHPLFPTADRENAAIVDHVIWFVHLFRMPVFFVLAGFFTALQIRRRGFGGMMRHRLLRIGVPFLLFVPIIHVTMTWLTMRAAATAAHPSPLLAWIRSMLEAGPLPPHPPGTSHLWFLYYLLLLLILTWVARSLDLGKVAARIASWPSAFVSIVIAGIVPIALAIPLATVPAPHPAPESFLPQFWALGTYGVFFTLGYLMRDHPEFLRRCTRWAPALIVGSLCLYVVFLALLAQRTPEQAFASATWPIALLEGAISVWMTLATLGLARVLLDHSNRVLAYLADASYWTYIVHLPILFAIQYRLLDVEFPWMAKFTIAVAGTVIASLVSYQLLVRHTRLSRVLGAAPRGHSPQSRGLPSTSSGQAASLR